MTLLELAERCEKAEGPDRELDERIGMAIGLKNTMRVGHECLGTDRVVPVGCPYYTASIDAAMTLVPSECYWRVGHDGEGRDPSMFAARVFDPLTMKRPCTAVAETPALALCAAALRAKEINHEQ